MNTDLLAVGPRRWDEGRKEGCVCEVLRHAMLPHLGREDCCVDRQTGIPELVQMWHTGAS